MWKSVLIGLTVVAVCHCQGGNNSVHVHKKPHYHDPYYHHLLYGGGILYYFTFLLIKIKVAIVLGTILTIFLVAGKFFALIKYADYMNKPHHEHTDKIYMPSPSHSHSHDVLDAPSYYSPPYGSDTRHTMTVDELPPNAVIAPQHYSPTMNGYRRSFSDKWNNYYDLYMAMLRKVNLTEIVFKKMNLKSIECKKKMVCKIEYNFNRFSGLSTFSFFIRDDDYDTYRPNATINSSTDCDRLYRQCRKVT
ncbi:uncharacterized protein LOC135136226 [Zophobas morio]|uniref:uncharacterized protein LOC135136226 n=1 Tax=Zophobas morio TaxID=2755281 RepID=UPI00308270AF